MRGVLERALDRVLVRTESGLTIEDIGPGLEELIIFENGGRHAPVDGTVHAMHREQE
jgi:hypothetical protein